MVIVPRRGAEPAHDVHRASRRTATRPRRPLGRSAAWNTIASTGATVSSALEALGLASGHQLDINALADPRAL